MSPLRQAIYSLRACRNPQTAPCSNISESTAITATHSPPGTKWDPRNLLLPSNTNSCSAQANCSFSLHRHASPSNMASHACNSPCRGKASLSFASPGEADLLSQENSIARVQDDAGNGACADCDCPLFLRTAAEINVITSPIGNGSRNVIAALNSGFWYSSLYLFSSSSFTWTTAALAPEALSFSTI